jgi:diacylglycerol kinase family enzyme
MTETDFEHKTQEDETTASEDAAVEATPESSRIDAQILLAAVTVGPSVGGGFLVAPDAEPDDGLLDLFVVERLGLLRVIRYLPSVLRGTIRGGREIHIGQATGLRIRSPEGRPFQFELDGELMPGETAELEIRVRSACLPVLELPERSG